MARQPLGQRVSTQPTTEPSPDVQQASGDDGSPGSGFSTILADPPWDVQQVGKRGAVQHYRLMSLSAIKALPAYQLAATNAHLWLWTTNAVLPHAADVMASWGFSYRSCLTWIKPRLGLGVYLRNQTEHLLFGVRGRAPIRFRSQGSWLYAPVQDHSHKPEEQYAVIERCSPGRYVELFARRPRAGWSVWGNEVPANVEVAQLLDVPDGR